MSSTSQDHTLTPGESVDFPSGYVARSWRKDHPYYAERTGDTLSPEFGTFAEARAWLAAQGAGNTTYGPELPASLPLDSFPCVYRGAYDDHAGCLLGFQRGSDAWLAVLLVRDQVWTSSLARLSFPDWARA